MDDKFYREKMENKFIIPTGWDGKTAKETEKLQRKHPQQPPYAANTSIHNWCTLDVHKPVDKVLLTRSWE